MDLNEKIELIKRNAEEIVTEEDLRELLRKKKPIAYCGYEPNGPMHLGHFVTIMKLIDLEKIGFHVKILLADIHALLNRKGNEKDIEKEVNNWRKTIKSIGINAEIVLGSDFEFSKEYQIDVMKLAQNTTINRGLRSMQEVARDVEHATISQLWYPLMQIADIKHLGVDLAVGGMEQRKIHMTGRESEKVLGHKFTSLHTSLITSLKGPGEKMSKSVFGSGISIVDSNEEIRKTMKNAYCPEKEIKDNPVLQICKLIIFPKLEKIEIKRTEKFGSNIKFGDYKDLEEAYAKGELHPLDLKNAISENLEKIIEPIRRNYK